MARVLGVVVMLVFLILVGCAPAAAPTPALTPLQPVEAPAALTSEEAAWAKVVEAAKKEGKVSIYSISYVGDIGVAVAKAFKDRYGIDVDIVTGSGSVFIPRLKAEARVSQGVGDLLESSAVFVTSLAKDKLTQSALEMPVLREKGVWNLEPLMGPEGHLFYSSPIMLFPWVNNNLVKPGEEPKSYKELLLPKWKGKIVESDPATIPALNILYWDFISRGILDEEYFRQLAKQDIKFVAGGIREALEKVARGESHINTLNIIGTAVPLLRGGAPIRPIDMEEGIIARGLGITIVKSAPHPNAAKVFLNWLLSQEGQAIQGKALQTASLRKDVENYTHPAARLTPRKTITETPKDSEEVERLMREGIVARIFGRK